MKRFLQSLALLSWCCWGCLRTLQAQTTPVTEALASSQQAFSALGAVVIVPVGGTVTDSETADLVRAINIYTSSPDRESFAPLEQFLVQYPHSAYRAGVLVNLGYLAYFYGYYSRALNDYEQAWAIAKAVKIPDSVEGQ